MHNDSVSRIRNRLQIIVEGLIELITDIPIHYRDLDWFIAPRWVWGEINDEQRAKQIELKREFEQVIELLRLLLRGAPEDTMRQLDEAEKEFRIWLELRSNWNLSNNRQENILNVLQIATKLEKTLDILSAVGKKEVIIVPDTNSLLVESDPVKYRKIARTDSVMFLLLPTVLGELDRLKVEHRIPEVRDKAKKVISRIKGWRQQGSLHTGVTIDKSILVKARHSEPDMNNTLSWLTADVQDDRIIASILQLQAEQPSSQIILVTGDINLMNKADAALINTAEISWRANLTKVSLNH
jgi:hypothetical protein